MTEENLQNKTYEDKFKRVVVAVTVGAVLLMVILLSVMVYQLVSIFSLKKAIRELDAEIQSFSQLTEEEQQKIEYISMKEYIIKRAEDLGVELPEGFD